MYTVDAKNGSVSTAYSNKADFDICEPRVTSVTENLQAARTELCECHELVSAIFTKINNHESPIKPPTEPDNLYEESLYLKDGMSFLKTRLEDLFGVLFGEK